MKVYVLAPKEDWICDRLSEEWKSCFKACVVDKPESADILWLLAGWCWNHISIETLKNKKVVLTVHHIVPQKFTQQKYQEFVFRDQFVDMYHVPNDKTANLVKQITNKPVYVISYWLNNELWNPVDKITAQKQLNLNSENFYVTSIQRDTEGYDLKTPKLEKGPDLFCDYLINNRDKFSNLHVLLGGWRRQYVQNRLLESKIPFTLFDKDTIEKVKLIYACTDLYVVSSRYEGGPQSLIECAAMNIPIISTDVGIASELLHPNCIVNIQDSFYIPTKNDIEYNMKKVLNLEINTHGKKFISLFSEVLSEKV